MLEFSLIFVQKIFVKIDYFNLYIAKARWEHLALLIITISFPKQFTKSFLWVKIGCFSVNFLCN